MRHISVTTVFIMRQACLPSALSIYSTCDALLIAIANILNSMLIKQTYYINFATLHPKDGVCLYPILMLKPYKEYALVSGAFGGFTMTIVNISYHVILGDSLSDGGRLKNGKPLIAEAAGLSKSPLGRFTNGYTWADEVAKLGALDILKEQFIEYIVSSVA